MKIQSILSELLNYFYTTRQCGHTTMLKKGVDSMGHERAIVVAPIEKSKSWMRRLFPFAKIYSLSQIGNGELRGKRLPMVLDNSAMTDILQKSLFEITKKEQIIDALEDKIYQLKDEVAAVHKQTHNIIEQLWNWMFDLNVTRPSQNSSVSQWKPIETVPYERKVLLLGFNPITQTREVQYEKYEEWMKHSIDRPRYWADVPVPDVVLPEEEIDK
jgi:hypothetical protein